MKCSVYDCVVLPLSKIHNRAGNITIVEGRTHLPFDIRRVFYLYDIPGGEGRGGHAHKLLNQLIVAASGAFDILLDDGTNKKIVALNRPDHGLLLVSGIWGKLMTFSSGAVCLVLASDVYDEQDYIRSYEDFLEFKNGF